MKVYNATTSAWDDVASVGNFYINTISSSSGTGGGSATFNGSAYRFTLSNAPTMAQQLIVSVNGVIQKPNAGSSQPSEGFAISGNDILFSAAPASGSDYFIVTQGSSVSIGTPSDNTVATAKIQNQAVTTAKITDANVTTAKLADDAVTTAKITDANVTNAKIADDTIAEVKLDISNAPADGKFLQYKDSSDKLTWATVDATPEGTVVKSTGESGTTKFLRVDGDGTCSWQVPPDTVYTHPNHSGEVTSTADGATVIASDVVDEDNLKISNAGTNGQYLQKQSGNTGGLTWADAGGGVASDSAGNTLGGTDAGDSIASGGNANTCFGYAAGDSITTGDNNTYIGYQAGKSSTGYQNTMVGRYYAGQNGDGYRNTAVGDQALGAVTSGHNNCCIGRGSGSYITTGNNNVSVGSVALMQLTTGTFNTTAGVSSMFNATTCTHNSAYGYKSLNDVTTGGNNNAFGYASGQNITTGTYNNALGESALNDCTTGYHNTAIGYNSGGSITTGYSNICIGNFSGGGSSPSGHITTGNNIVCICDNSIANAYCASSWSTSSDKRDKTDINDFTYGLKWINQLKPVTYRWDKRSWYSDDLSTTPDGSKKKEKQHIGFLAQDVLAVEQSDGFASKKDDMLVVTSNEDDTSYGIQYERLVPVLVNAIKELSTKVETLETKVAALEAK